MTKALIVDDDEKIGLLLKKFFLSFQIESDFFNDSLNALEQLNKEQYDIIILDLMMPKLDGIEFCKHVRQNSEIPIIMLTARGELTDKVLGLEVGADDYLAKPFEPRELVARIKSVLRRSLSSNNDNDTDYTTLVSSDLLLNLKTRDVLLADNQLKLTSMEYDLLKHFMENPNQVLTRDDLMDSLKGVDWNVYDRSIDINISRLRKKLEDSSKEPRFIKTIWGSGYIFSSEVVKK
ncbi:response regulator transcription factor [Halobacteriovorax sp. GB3]|uniref:response regulator n=1 Tax=Halobacteriovorax sp. GB3 TaxID=2719615 RepID=UPI00235EC749|nr:response regulator transcription factor [Halobacteriovorax sp. GB3]MDD0851508.1 response regulator transcription factor [Halobacteriovorax sp. GB3]